ncbi:MAG TPA: M20/M25/M40 family metallo-hydrolase [Candidatus Humimicrobiaceae bacterium]
MDVNGYKLNIDTLLKNFFEILKIKSISRNERNLFDFVKVKLENLGLIVFEDDCGSRFGGNTGNLIATYIPKVIKNNPPIFLSAHLDTVPHNSIIEPAIIEGKIINSNSSEILGSDDKAAIAAILEAFSFLIINNIPTGIIYIIFTVGEELALFGSRYLDTRLIDTQYGFVFDADGSVGSIINKAPYHNRLNFTVRGKATHAGVSPEKGINSIKSAALAITNIASGRIDDETTCNIGIIKGGVETNIVPESTEVNAEARSMSVDKLNKLTNEIVDQFLKASKLSDTSLEYEVLREYDGYEIAMDSLTIKIAEYAFNKIGIKPKIKSSGGGSDTNNFNSKGMKAVNLSTGIENCHSTEEYIKVEELGKLVKLIIEICRFNKEEI